MQEMDPRNQNFLGGMLQPPIEGRVYARGVPSALGAFMTRQASLHKSLDAPLELTVISTYR